MKIDKKTKKKVMKNIEYGGKYAIADLYFGKVVNLFLFCEMEKKGYDLIGLNFGQAVFKKKAVKKK